MTAIDARAYLEKSIDNVEDLPDDLAWTNAEVLEMLTEAVGLFEQAHTPTDDERESAQAYADAEYPEIKLAPENEGLAEVAEEAFLAGVRFRRPVQGEPTAETVHRGTFGHVWPCPLFYVGNWKRIENGHEPVRDCSSPAACAPPPVQGEPTAEPVGIPEQLEPTGALSTSEHNAWVQGWNAAVEAQGEPTDAQVEAAARELFNRARPGNEYADLTYAEVRAEYEAGARAALRAAFQAGENR